MRFLLYFLIFFFSLNVYSQSNKALYFSDGTENLKINNKDLFNLDALTIGFWIKPEKAGNIIGANPLPGNSNVTKTMNDVWRLDLDSKGNLTLIYLSDLIQGSGGSVTFSSDIQFGEWNFIVLTLTERLLGVSVNTGKFHTAFSKIPFSAKMEIYFGSLPQGKIEDGKPTNHFHGIKGYIDQINVYQYYLEIKQPMTHRNILYTMFDNDLFNQRVYSEKFSKQNNSYTLNGAEIYDSNCFEITSLEKSGYLEFISTASPKVKNSSENHFSFSDKSNHSFALISAKSSAFYFMDKVNNGKINYLSIDTVLIQSANLEKINVSLPWSYNDNVSDKKFAVFIFDDKDKIKEVVLGDPSKNNGHLNATIPLYSDYQKIMFGGITDVFDLTATHGFGPFKSTYDKGNTFSVTNAGAYDDLELKIRDYINLKTVDSTYASDLSDSVSISSNLRDLSANSSVIAKATTSDNPGIDFIINKHVSIIPLHLNITSARGFQPFRLGNKSIRDTIQVDSLPKNTNKIVMEILDNNGLKISGSDALSKTITGSNLNNAQWIVNLGDLPLVLGSQLKITVFQEGGFKDGYSEFIPLQVQPPKMYIGSQEDKWDFYTNNFDRVTNKDAPWQEFGDRLQHPFRVFKIPPRTRKIEYQLFTNDEMIFSGTRLPQSGKSSITDGVFSVKMDTIPVKTNIMKCFVYADGGPDNGMEVTHLVHMKPNRPRISLNPENFDPVPNNPLDTNQKKVTNVEITVEPSFQQCKNVELKILTVNNDVVIDTILSVNPAKNTQGQELSYDEAKVTLNFADLDPASKYIYAKAIDPDGIFLSDSTIDITLKTPLPIVNTLMPFKKRYKDNIPDTVNYVEGQGLYEIFEFSGLPEKTTKVDIKFNLEQYTREVLKLSGNNQAAISESIVDQTNSTYNISDYSINTRFKTTTNKGGVLVSFINSKDFNSGDKYNKILWMSDDGKLNFYNYSSQNTPNEVVISTDESYNDGNWHQVAAVFEIESNTDQTHKSSLKIYVDGKKVKHDQKQGTNDLYYTQMFPGYWRIGHAVSGVYQPQPSNKTFNGLISDVGIFEHGIADSTAERLHNANLSNPVEIESFNIKYYWDLRGSGNEIVRNNNLTFHEDSEWYDDKEHKFALADSIKKSLTSLNGPQKNSISLSGKDTYLSKKNNSIHYNYDNHSNFASFTIMTWFKTRSSQDQMIMSFNESLNETNSKYINFAELTSNTNGQLVFSFKKSGCDSIKLTTQKSYNDNSWHHVACVMENGVMKLFVDGSLTDTHSESTNCEFEFSNYDMFVAYNPNSKSINYFDGELSDISLWNTGLDYIDIIKYIFDREAVKKNNLCQSFLIFSEENKKSDKYFTDLSFWNNDGSDYIIHGSDGFYLKSPNELTSVYFPINIENLSSGLYDLGLKLYFNNSTTSDTEFNLIVKVNKPWFNSPEDAIVVLNSDGGFGYFTEGSNNNLNLRLTTRQFNKGDNLKLDLYDKKPSEQGANKLMDTEEKTVNGPSTNFTLNTSSAKPGSWIEISGGSNNDRLFYPLLVLPGIPPQLNGNLANVVESIAPGTMKDTRKFTIKNSEDAMSKIQIRAMNSYNEPIADTVIATKVNEELWKFSYNMAELRAPHSYLVMETFFNNNDIPDTTIFYPVDVAKRRPDWFTSYMKFSNINEKSGKVSFTVDGFIDKPNIVDYMSNVDFVENDPFAKTPVLPKYYVHPNEARNYVIPDKVPILGGKPIDLPYTELKVDLEFNKETKKLKITDEPVLKYNDALFGVTLKNHTKSISNYENILDSKNNLLLTDYTGYSYQGNLFGPSVLTTLLRLKEILDDIRKLEIADLAKIYFDIQPAYAISRGQFVNVKPDSNKWGNVGSFDIKSFDINNMSANKDITSFSYRQDGIGVTMGVGADLLSGLADVNISVTSRFLFGVLSANHDLPSPQFKKYFSVNNQVFVKADAEFCWGLIDKTIFGPELVHTFHLSKNEIPPIIPKPKDWPSGLKVKPNNELQSKHSGKSSVFSYTSETSPQPEMDSYDRNVVSCWLEQDVNTKSSKLMLSHFDPDENRFLNPAVIAENNSGMSDPQISIYKDKAYVTWVQNRHNATNVPQDADISYLLNTSDIWFAVYDLQQKKLLHRSVIDDDFENYDSGRIEGNPYVAAISDDKAMLSWLVVDKETYTSDIYYSKLDYNGSDYSHSEPAVLYASNEKESDFNLNRTTEDKCVITWKSYTGNGEDQKVMSAHWNGQSWSMPNTVAESSENFKINDLDFDMFDDKGMLCVTVHNRDDEDADQLHIYHWNNDMTSWESNELKHKLTETYPRDLRVSVTEDKAVVLFEENKTYILDDSHLGESDMLVYDFNEPNEITHIDANPYFGSHAAKNWHFDFDFVSNDIMFLLTNEVKNPGNTHEPEFGQIFGNPVSNLILRAYKINSDNAVEDVDENDVKSDVSVPMNYPDEHFIDVYPQPSSGNLTIENGFEDKIKLIGIYDINGNLVSKYDIDIIDSYFINLKLSSGFYFLGFEYKNGIIRKPVIKLGN